MTDWLPALTEAFGPAGAIVIFGLAIWGWAERSAKNDAQEKRIEEIKTHSRELFETIGAIKDLRMRLEDRR